MLEMYGDDCIVTYCIVKFKLVENWCTCKLHVCFDHTKEEQPVAAGTFKNGNFFCVSSMLNSASFIS